MTEQQTNPEVLRLIEAMERVADDLQALSDRIAEPAGELSDAQIMEALNGTSMKFQADCGYPAPRNLVALARAVIAADRAQRQAVQEPVARLEGVDEYGPRLEWMTHWVDVPVGTKLYAAPRPQTAEPAQAPPVDEALRLAVDRTRDDLGVAGDNYPAVRKLLTFAEAHIKALSPA